MADRFGLCYCCSLTEDQKEELYNVIKGGEENVLKRAMVSKADETSSYFWSYEHTEVFCSISVQHCRLLVPKAMVLQYALSPKIMTYYLDSVANHELGDYWHTSEDDDREHATFRLFDDAPWRPWNYRTYHLYKDGTSKSWAYEKWEAEERPT